MALRGTAHLCLTLVFLAVPLRATDPPPPNDDLQQIQAQAEALKAQAEACAAMKCPVCDCASLSKMMQALLDAETVVDALHSALIDANADLSKHYFDLGANSHLTGTKLAQLQTSLAWQEFFHKLGSYLLKIESILNTLNGIDQGTFKIDGDKGALDLLDRLDSLANALKNAADITTDLSGQIALGEVPATADAKQLINTGWDFKGEAVDAAKVARDVRNAYKESGAAGLVDALKSARNLRTLIARTLKLYSERKLAEEKAVLRELTATENAEAAAMTSAYQEWQRTRERMYSAESALAALREARAALEACMAKAKCGSKTLSRPALPKSASWGEALKALDALLPSASAGLKGSIVAREGCPEPGATPEPQKPGQPVTPTPTPPPPKHVVENNCPPCASLALELARTLDEMEFVRSELGRIRANLEKATALESDAELLRKAIQSISELIFDFREGKKAKNALLQAGEALFRQLNKPYTAIDLEVLEREKRERQNQLHTLEEKIKALRAEEGLLPQLEKENLRLYELSEKLKADLTECQKQCVPPPAPRMKSCFNEKSEFDHWDAKQKQYPSSSNKSARGAALKKLCRCLSEHPEEATEELRKLCPEPTRTTPPPPGRVGGGGRTPSRPPAGRPKTKPCRVALVLPSDSRPGDQVSGTVVDNPQDWKGAVGVTLVELELTLPVDDAGKPLLHECTVSFDGGPPQPADGTVTCRVPTSGETHVSIGTNGNPTPAGETTVACNRATQPAEPTIAAPLAPAVCVKDQLFTLRGSFSGDANSASVTFADKQASIAAGSPREWHCLPPGDTAPGTAELVYTEGGRSWSATTAFVALEMSAAKTQLLRGETTTLKVRVPGAESIPASAWSAPVAIEPAQRALMAEIAPELPLRDGESGRIYLVLENRSREVISIEGESDGRIVVTIDPASLRNGTFVLSRQIQSKQRGGFNIHGTLVVLLAPVELQPVSAN